MGKSWLAREHICLVSQQKVMPETALLFKQLRVWSNLGRLREEPLSLSHKGSAVTTTLEC